jgi:arsenate reductase
MIIARRPARVRIVYKPVPYEEAMTLKIYHNPRCSKSRKTLELLTESGVAHSVVRYLENTPDTATICALAEGLALATWLTEHPIVLERPIVVDESTGKAIIGRPPENVLTLVSP